MRAGAGCILDDVTAPRSDRPRRRGSALGRYVRRLLIAALVLALAAVFGPTLLVLAAAAGRTHEALDEVPARDVTLVLGAGLDAQGGPSPFLKARLDLAADLYRAGRTKVIIVSGAVDGYHNEPAAMARYLSAQRGVPQAHIVRDDYGFNTWSSCVRAKKVFGVDRLTVVTQAYHLPRAVAACRFAGVDAQGYGDTSVKHYRDWRRGQVREIGANIKLVHDWGRDAQPALEPRRDDVDRALAGR